MNNSEAAKSISKKLDLAQVDALTSSVDNKVTTVDVSSQASLSGLQAVKTSKPQPVPMRLIIK